MCTGINHSQSPGLGGKKGNSRAKINKRSSQEAEAE